MNCAWYERETRTFLWQNDRERSLERDFLTSFLRWAQFLSRQAQKANTDTASSTTSTVPTTILQPRMTLEIRHTTVGARFHVFAIQSDARSSLSLSFPSDYVPRTGSAIPKTHSVVNAGWQHSQLQQKLPAPHGHAISVGLRR